MPRLLLWAVPSPGSWEEVSGPASGLWGQNPHLGNKAPRGCVHILRHADLAHAAWERCPGLPLSVRGVVRLPLRELPWKLRPDDHSLGS